MAPWEEYQAMAVAEPTATPTLKPWEEYAAADTELPEVVATKESGNGLVAKINALLGGKEGVSERPSQLGVEAGKAAPEGIPFVRGFGETASHVVPQSWGELGGLAESFVPPIEAYRQVRQGIDIASGKPAPEVIPGITELKDLEDLKTEFGGDSPEYQSAAGKAAGNVLSQMIMAGLVGKSLHVPPHVPLRGEPLAPEPPRRVEAADMVRDTLPDAETQAIFDQKLAEAQGAPEPPTAAPEMPATAPEAVVPSPVAGAATPEVAKPVSDVVFDPYDPQRTATERGRTWDKWWKDNIKGEQTVDNNGVGSLNLGESADLDSMGNYKGTSEKSQPVFRTEDGTLVKVSEKTNGDLFIERVDPNDTKLTLNEGEGPVQEVPTPPQVTPLAPPVSPGALKQLAKLKAHKAQVEAIGGTVDPKVTAKIAEIEGAPPEAPVNAQEAPPIASEAPGGVPVAGGEKIVAAALRDAEGNVYSGDNHYTAMGAVPEAIDPQTLSGGWLTDGGRFIPEAGKEAQTIAGSPHLNAQQSDVMIGKATTPPVAETPAFTFGEPAYHGDTQYTLHKRGNNVEVGQINASSAGGGIKFLQDLTRWADENGMTLSGDARPMRPRENVRGLPQDKLKRLYRQFGFEEYGDYDRMMRVPREKPPTPPVVETPVAPEPYTQEAAAQRAAAEAAQPAPQAFSEEPHVSSIANRFTAERAATGELGEIKPGESINTMDLVHHGLKMSPEKVNESISRIMQGGDVPINDAAAIRGEEARLSQRSGDLSRAARANPSPEAQLAADNAFKDLTDFHNGPVAQAKRNWHHQGKLMQGEIPVDLSTLNGMREAWLKDTGKPPPAHVEPKLQKAADKLAKAIDEERAAARNGGDAIEKATRARKLPTPEEVRNNIADRMKVEPCII